jgi:RNA 2',3'-cyclic 3'-phosphodiesterase
MSEPTRRLFFALWPDEPSRVALVHATRKAVRHSGGRPVAEHNLHTTLLFLGSVAESRVSEVATIGARAAAETLVARDDFSWPPGFVFDRIELWQKAHVLVATTSASSGGGHLVANALVGSLQRETSGAGFAPDLKPFRPHVTLARKVAFLRTVLRMEPVEWRIAGFTLVESRTDPDGPVYTVLQSYPLEPHSGAEPCSSGTADR